MFSNALIEQLTDPARAMRELLPVLKPGGVIGVSSPDWGGFVLASQSDALAMAVEPYTTLQTSSGGDVHVGRKLGSLLAAAGFENRRMSARYEVYSSLPLIGEYLALHSTVSVMPRQPQHFASGADNPAGCLLNVGYRASLANRQRRIDQ